MVWGGGCGVYVGPREFARLAGAGQPERHQGGAQGRSVHGRYRDQNAISHPADETVQLLVMSKSGAEANNATEASDITQKKENFANRHTNGTGPFIMKSREVDIKTEFV